MIISRKEYEKMKTKLEVLQDLYECYKGDREIYYEEHRSLRIAESLLTPEQEMEYYRLLSEQAKAEE